ncbi:zinc ribbon domain-containing protein [Microseira sp. BLCC-F43]|jgi:hypothetical protein|uniref:zinc ribbon domain-containing protein n=1 Tax=Microseira sp. BLCC-F43 TaxID=3153602 RepID=UPI0035B764D7
MYSLKLELKLNNKERSRLAGGAGFSRKVYNFGLSLLVWSWGFEGIKARESKGLTQMEKVLTNHVKTKAEYAGMKQYPSAIYSSAMGNLAKAVEGWRQGETGSPQYKSKKSRDSFTVLKKSGANIRSDLWQKKTNAISRKYYLIPIDLNSFGRIANSKIAKYIGSLGLYECRRMGIDKQALYGTQVEVVDRWFPWSKTCSKCGHVQPMPLPKRVFNCGACKNAISRDLNAAINLEHAPPDRVRRATPEFTPADKKMPSSLVEAGNKRQFKRNA